MSYHTPMCNQLDHITYIGGAQIFQGRGGAENDLDNLEKIQPHNFWILGSLRTPPPKKNQFIRENPTKIHNYMSIAL